MNGVHMQYFCLLYSDRHLVININGIFTCGSVVFVVVMNT